MTIKKPLVSICIPVLNEELCLEALYIRLTRLADAMAHKCDFEYIFTDNCSTDGTWQKLLILSSNDNRVKALRFSKNVGFQKSILTNYRNTQGNAVVQIDADMQDPPELINDFFDLWTQGYKIVYGVRRKRPEHVLMTAFRKLGYYVVDKLSDHPIPRNVGDFRFMDRLVVDTLLNEPVAIPYLRGQVASYGFKSSFLEFDRVKREEGSSKFRISHLLTLGFASIFNHSTVPLRLSSYVGAFAIIFSIIGSIYYLMVKAFSGYLPPGLASIHILVLFAIGLNSFFLGVLGEYILRIYLIVRKDPTAIVTDKINFN